MDEKKTKTWERRRPRRPRAYPERVIDALAASRAGNTGLPQDERG